MREVVGQFQASNTETQIDATVVIFGASGDLTARKLVPALYLLFHQGYLSPRSIVVGVARRSKTDESFRNEMWAAVNHHSRGGTVSETDWKNFGNNLFYRQIDIADPSQYDRLEASLSELEQSRSLPKRRLVYLATTPELFIPSIEGISKGGLVPSTEEEGWLRVVVEKPFGHDLESSQDLSQRLCSILKEDQIYRIDHYLGKETVQNILLFRFGNAIFEPLFNRTHIDHIQITVAETQGMERGRGGYYDKSGAMRDVLQNHVLQLLCLVAMEPPALFRAKEIRDEKLKVLQALAPGHHNLRNWAIAGQYTPPPGDKSIPGYLEEDRIPKNSRTETFVALDVRVDNWRWAGVPFLLRTGKRLPARVTEIAIQFKLPPLHLFTTVECEGDLCDLVGARPNRLVFRIQPRESISLSCSTKRPGMQYQIHPVDLEFEYERAFHLALPEAYERLLLDVLRGDSTLFTRDDELEAAWRFVTPILESWKDPSHVPYPYTAGTWGPSEADALLSRYGGARWRAPKGT